jgi:hypothetical protein
MVRTSYPALAGAAIAARRVDRRAACREAAEVVPLNR